MRSKAPSSCSSCLAYPDYNDASSMTRLTSDPDTVVVFPSRTTGTRKKMPLVASRLEQWKTVLGTEERPRWYTYWLLPELLAAPNMSPGCNDFMWGISTTLTSRKDSGFILEFYNSRARILRQYCFLSFPSARDSFVYILEVPITSFSAWPNQDAQLVPPLIFGYYS